jgi:hypothetical protein
VASQLVGAVSVREDLLHAERLPDVTRGIPGLAGEYLSVAICNVTWPTQGLDVLGRVMEDLELELRFATPIAQAVAAALPVPDAILLDIGHEHTEIALAEGGALSALATLTMGGQLFTEDLMRHLNLAEKHAEFVKRRWCQRRTPSGREPAARVLARTTRRWLQLLEQRLLEIAGDAPLPPRIYLYGGGALLPPVAEGLRNHPWPRRLPFDRHPVVERLQPQALRCLHDPRGLLCTPSHVGLAALAAWAGNDPPPLQKRLNTLTARLAPAFDLI